MSNGKYIDPSTARSLAVALRMTVVGVLAESTGLQASESGSTGLHPEERMAMNQGFRLRETERKILRAKTMALRMTTTVPLILRLALG